MPAIEFTDNHEDLSTEHGFQFKFYCESCGNGYMSSWNANKTGIAGSVLRSAGSFFGGVLGNAANSSYDIQEAIGGPAHDRALGEAVAEIRPLFAQCKRCGNWVCREVCWNDERGLCASCAPIAQRELGAIQANVTVEQLEEKVRAQDMTRTMNVTSTAVVECPSCGAEAGSGKFCQECGKPLAARTECPRCGTQMESKAKFCPECGHGRE